MKNIIGDLSLKFLGEKLNFNEISENLNMKPTELYKKGNTFKIGKRTCETENDAWYYIVQFDEDSNPNEILEQILEGLQTSKEYINNLSKSVYISIRYAIQSEMAQIYFEFPSSILKKLSEFNINLEMSIFSWGGVEYTDE
jgi:hypothetical protein